MFHKHSIHLSPVLLGLILSLAACSEDDAVDGSVDEQTGEEAGEGELDSGTPGDDTLSAIERGEPLYEQYCAFCHASDGTGYLADEANALSNQEFLKLADDAFLSAAIIHGRPGTPMSPWGVEKGGPLDAQNVSDIVAFIRAWQTEESIDPDGPELEGVATRGLGPYNAFCASCHGSEGEGVSALSLNNPWFLETADDGFIAHSILVGRPGTTMPAFRNQLNDQALADIVALIRSWQVPVDSEPLPPFEPQVDQALLNPEGEAASFELREGRFAPAEQVRAAMVAEQSFVVIDARPAADYLDEHISGAISLPFYQIQDYLDQLPRDRFVITYCGCPHAVSGQAADALLEAGFEQVAVLDEGFYEWRDTFGFPTSSGEEPGDPLATQDEAESASSPE